MLREYINGDEYRIVMTDESREFFDKDPEYYKFHLLYDESYTCLDSKGKVDGIMCFSLDGEKVYKVWALFDRYRGKHVLKSFKRLIDAYKKEGNILYTVSTVSDKQTKMHRFFGGEEREMYEEKQVWVA